LVPAGILLQLDYIKGVCVEFLLNQLNTSNCLGIKEFADFYNCMEFLSSSEEYIKTHFCKLYYNCQWILFINIMVMIFRKVVEADEFLPPSSEEVFYLISRDDINVLFEEKVCRKFSNT